MEEDSNVTCWSEEYYKRTDLQGKNREFSLGNIEVPTCGVVPVRQPSKNNPLGGRVDKEYWKYGLEIDFFFFFSAGH
jgi:hypothetical protein